MKILIVLFSALVLAACATGGGNDPQPHHLCDIDGDGEVNFVVDGSMFLWSFGSFEGDHNYVPNADFDRDGEVSTLDYGVWYQQCYITGIEE